MWNAEKLKKMGKEKVEWEKQQNMKDTPLDLPLLPWRWRQQIAHQQIPEDSRPNVCYLKTSFPHETLLTTKQWNIFTNVVQKEVSNLEQSCLQYVC